mgnify:FL=1
MAKLADDIDDAEVWLEQVERELALAQSIGDPAEITRLQAELETAQTTLDELTTAWEKLDEGWG